LRGRGERYIVININTYQMDPQVKGAILGGVGTAAVLSLGYIMKRSFSKNELPVETQLTTS
jgi:hypothetical protein